MRVLILHDDVPPGARADELDTLAQADALGACLEELGHGVDRMAFPGDLALARREVLARRPDVVFNLVESVDRQGRLAHLAPALLDAIGLPYTGCGAASMYLTNGKLLAKRLLADAGLPTPDWFESRDLERDGAIEGPWIIKSAWEHASVGLDEASVVRPSTMRALHAELRDRLADIGGEGFAERFVDGREFNVALLQTEDAVTVLPSAEIEFRGYGPEKARVVGFRAKWEEASFEYTHTVRVYEFPPTDASLLEALSHLSLACWRLFGLRGAARVDFRVDDAGRPWILEVNANPCLTPGAGFCAAAERAGIGLREIVDALVAGAVRAVHATTVEEHRL